MEEQSVGRLLLEDIETNIAFIELLGLAAAIVIAVIGAVLAARAAALLSEARFLFWRMHEIEKNVKTNSGQTERWRALRNAARRQKATQTRRRGRYRSVV
jgi:hypothetical protein